MVIRHEDDEAARGSVLDQIRNRTATESAFQYFLVPDLFTSQLSPSPERFQARNRKMVSRNGLINTDYGCALRLSYTTINILRFCCATKFAVYGVRVLGSLGSGPKAHRRHIEEFIEQVLYLRVESQLFLSPYARS